MRDRDGGFGRRRGFVFGVLVSATGTLPVPAVAAALPAHRDVATGR